MDVLLINSQFSARQLHIHRIATLTNNTTFTVLNFDEDSEHMPTNILMLCIASLIMFGIIFGNMLTIIAVCKYETLKKVGNSFIVSLATADLLVGLSVLTLYFVDTLKYYSNGIIFCVIYLTNDIMCCTTSIFSITCISIDRHIAITDHLQYTTRITPKVAGSLICCTWVISAAYVPVLISGILETQYIYIENNSCLINFLNPTLLTITIVAFFIPCLMMLTAYEIIFKVGRKQEAEIHEMAQVANTIHGQTTSSRASVRKSNKVAKTLGFITGMFLICWIPFFIIVVISYFQSYKNRNIPISLWNFIHFLTYTNSMLNPIIYTLCNDNFHKALAKILGRR